MLYYPRLLLYQLKVLCFKKKNTPRRINIYTILLATEFWNENQQNQLQVKLTWYNVAQTNSNIYIHEIYPTSTYNKELKTKFYYFKQRRRPVVLIQTKRWLRKEAIIPEAAFALIYLAVITPKGLGLTLDYSNWTMRIVYHIIAHTAHNNPEENNNNNQCNQNPTKQPSQQQVPQILIYFPSHVPN